MKQPINVRVHNKAVILLLLPVTVLFWLVGWSFFCTGCRSTSQRKKPPAEKDALVITGIVAENSEIISEISREN